MSHQKDSAKVIIIALLANLGIAIAKLFGAAISKSASLLAEAIHSLVDCTNQVLLLVGSRKAQKPADELHPLGYGRETFFWSFIVAILLFSMGGVFAIYEGIHKLTDHEVLGSPWLGLSILLVSMGLEAFSFHACLKEVKKQNKFGSLFQWFKRTSNSELLVIFTEDLAALLGLCIAFLCLVTASVTGNSQWDAIGSIAVGLLLVVVAIFLGVEIKSFIIGEASSDEIKKFMEQKTIEMFPGGKILRFIALQTGSNEVMISCKLHPGDMKSVDEAIDTVNRLEKLCKETFPELRWQFIELDKYD